MLEASATIHAPATTTWRLLTDTRARPDWGPSVRAVDRPARLIGADARGQVQTALGLWLPFRITAWEPEVFWAWCAETAAVSSVSRSVDGESLT
jgi:uncharacterized protein YndB with AHSA1/START domain